MGMVGPMELGIIVFIALLIFGPSQIPKIGRSIGATVRELRGAGKALTESLEEEKEK
jgi:sec-independent protein translocase protein TatA